MPTSCGGGTRFCCREPDLSPPASKHFIKTGGYALRTRSKEESATLRWNAKPGSPSMPTSCGGGTKFCCRGRDLSPPELKKRSLTASGSALRQRSKEGWNPTANENREFGTLNWSSRPPRNVGGTWGCRREAQAGSPKNPAVDGGKQVGGITWPYYRLPFILPGHVWLPIHFYDKPTTRDWDGDKKALWTLGLIG